MILEVANCTVFFMLIMNQSIETHYCEFVNANEWWGGYTWGNDYIYLNKNQVKRETLAFKWIALHEYLHLLGEHDEKKCDEFADENLYTFLRR